MITIGCAGFPIPTSRYFKEFLFVEIQETHVALPGTGTLRRWHREAPEDFQFALLGPRILGQENNEQNQVAEEALAKLEQVSLELKSSFVVFTSPAEFAVNRANKKTIKELFTEAASRFERVVWDPPASWEPEEAEALVEKAGVIVARDPLRYKLTRAPFAYYRLPGPAGYKSRYEDPAIEKLIAVAKAAKNKEAIYVFANVDMFNDAKRFRKGLRA